MENELERELSGQAVTRLEAFVEMLTPVQIDMRST
jgi:benzoyl-CoA reductase/2-hydroxyglutaryl-CoA dehydratase subunit BcrC/BadD/HgdB